MPDAVDTVVCTPDDGWKYHPKYVEQFPDINKLCSVAFCRIYIGILLGAHPILHISRIKVKSGIFFVTVMTCNNDVDVVDYQGCQPVNEKLSYQPKKYHFLAEVIFKFEECPTKHGNIQTDKIARPSPLIRIIRVTAPK
jgi:hypothetical protein